MSDSPAPADSLSPLARRLVDAHADAYGRLVVEGGTPAEARRLLGGVTAGQLLTGRPAARGRGADEAASALLCGLWLWHDGLEESHAISQATHTPTGSFWHAILHRREGDFWNSKYWYARCRGHAALATIGERARPVLATLMDAGRAAALGRGGWNPDAFVDWVEQLQARPDPAEIDLAVKLQRIEWQGLFDTCAADAVRG